jgi:hypothetical protein
VTDKPLVLTTRLGCGERELGTITSDRDGTHVRVRCYETTLPEVELALCEAGAETVREVAVERKAEEHP